MNRRIFRTLIALFLAACLLAGCSSPFRTEIIENPSGTQIARLHDLLASYGLLFGEATDVERIYTYTAIQTTDCVAAFETGTCPMENWEETAVFYSEEHKVTIGGDIRIPYEADFHIPPFTVVYQIPGNRFLTVMEHVPGNVIRAICEGWDALPE